jgi:hypothetical protein
LKKGWHSNKENINVRKEHKEENREIIMSWRRRER